MKMRMKLEVKSRPRRYTSRLAGETVSKEVYRGDGSVVGIAYMLERPGR